VDEVASWVGDAREETGDEVGGDEDLDFLVVVAVPGQIRGGLRTWNPPPRCLRRERFALNGVSLPQETLARTGTRNRPKVGIGL